MKRKDKPIKICGYARKRMHERGISEDQVVRTIRESDRAAIESDNGDVQRVRFEKSLTKRKRLIVVADEEKDAITVVTAYFK